jgi:valyl-tRNA synthetase
MQLAKGYDPHAVEQKWYAHWEARGYFRPEAVTDPTGPPFVMVIPPPNVTGSLHMGHALNNTLQDIQARYHRMNGRPVLWLPGTDHAGIATQVVVERQLPGGAAERRAMGREAFAERVWAWKAESGSTITRQLRRLGVSCDWTRERFTLDDGLSRAVREVFVTLYEDGLVYRGNRLINWCVACQTALSDLEVEYSDGDGTLYHLRYGDVSVATVRPETKLGDTGLAVHPDDERYRHLVGTRVTFATESGELTLPVIADEAVDPAFGTGVVKVTPAHDPADWEMGERHGLEVKSVIGPDGRMTEAAGAYAGLDRFECRARIVDDLRARGLLEREEPYRNRIGACYRCHQVVEPLVSRQWFVKIAPLAEPAIAAVRDGRTRFVPPHWANTYFAWMENIRDWCISRQLWWGHRIPAWTCLACNELIVARDDPAACPHCGGAVEQDPDVLDTWFSSGLWPFSTLGWPADTADVQRFYPTSLLVTGFDIIFFWVARMMMLGLRFRGDVPFRDVYIHGLVRDPEGQKMSKSKGNVIDPLAILDTSGTDALRFALTAFAAMGRDIKLSPQRIEGYRNFTNKLWNAVRFVLMHLENAGPGTRTTAETLAEGRWPEGLDLPDRWIVSRLEGVTGAVRAALDEYRFNEAAGELYHFAWHELCDWYLEAAKGPLAAGGDAAERTRGVLLYVLERYVRLLHPLMPFLTEEVWQVLVAEGWAAARPARFAESIMIASYPAVRPALQDGAAETEMARLVAVVRAVRNLRSEYDVRPSQAVEAQVYAADAATRARLGDAAVLIATLARLEPFTVLARPERPSGAAVEMLDGIELYVPLAGLVADLAGEQRRLERELEKVAKDLSGVEAKLGNPHFTERAPDEIVAEVRGKGEALGERRQALERSLERLRALEA